MKEPRELDWGPGAHPQVLPDIAPRVPELLALFRTKYADREALVHDQKRFTYGSIEQASARLATNLIDAGIGKGAHVGLLLPDDERFLISWLAVTRIGGVAVALSTLVTPAELQRLSKHADLQLIIAVTGFLSHDYVAKAEEAFAGIAQQQAPFRLASAPMLRGLWFWDESGTLPSWTQAIELDGPEALDRSLLEAAESDIQTSDPCGIIYTSGSTAEPKGVIHSHGNLIRQGMKLAVNFDYRSDERVFSTLPFFWVGGLATTMLCAMVIGATIVGSARKGTALVDMLEAERVTAVISWPHILRGIAEDPTFAARDWSAMRNGLLYEALPPERCAQDPALMPTPLGMTETVGPYTRHQRRLPEEHRGSLGPLMPGIEGRLVDPDSGKVIAIWRDSDSTADSGGAVGVMQLKADILMLGMVKREHRRVFTEDGWYHSGDLCSFRQGYLYFHGRADDLIKASGANVSPAEVELAIRGISGVASAIVLGVPEEERGSVVGAVVMPEAGAKLTADDVRAETTRLLSSYKRPRAVLIMDAGQIPMLPSRKVDRLALVGMLQDELRG
ncbi:MAG: class I adenylate-forming enzyme family protein [Novosphingobium sp.]|nr:class I adenylate-forming enzyme family protein [Novosphingobium sp.]